MDRRRARILAGGTVMLWFLMAATTGTAVGADCALAVPETVLVGTAVTIDGSGFPANADVDIALTVAGGAADGFPVTTNASGGFSIGLTPETADLGRTAVTATAATCSAQAVYTVVSMLPEAAPTAAGTADTVSGGATAPQTDVAAPLPTAPGPSTGWLLAIGLVTTGSLGRLATRRGRTPKS